MAHPDQLRILVEQGVEAWNQWRTENVGIEPDLGAANLGAADLRRVNLSRADLSNAVLRKADLTSAYLYAAILIEADLSEAILSNVDLNQADLRGSNFRWADLRGAGLRKANLKVGDLRVADLRAANLSEANLSEANLSNAHLNETNLSAADLSRANLRQANLSKADLRWANLREANLTGADLRGADLSETDLSEADLYSAIVVRTNLSNANLTGCNVYGISSWDLNLAGAVQKNLVITPEDQPTIQVDRLDIAQFIYLLLNNAEIRHVIDTITSKVVLILGRFTKERKPVLDGIREQLRKRDYVPVLFDFDQPSSQTTMETITTLAGMARFVIADLTDAKSVLQELRGIVPERPSLPVQPLMLADQYEPGMIDFFKRYPWFLDIVTYTSQKELLTDLTKVIAPAEVKLAEIRTA